MAIGKVTQIIGPVIDCEFDRSELPRINEAIRINKRSNEDQPESDEEEDTEGAAAPAKDAFKPNASDYVYAEVLQQTHESQHARPPCPSPTPRVYPNPCPSSR